MAYDYYTDSFYPENLPALVQSPEARQAQALSPVGQKLAALAALGGVGYAGNSLLSSPALPTLTEATQASWNAPALEATQAAWNGPATEGAISSVTPGASSAWSLGGFGSAGNAYAPIIGAALAGDVLLNKRHGGRGLGEGALAGAGIGSYFGPWGALAGALLGGGVGYFGNFGDKDRFQSEYKRAQALRDKGLNWDLNTVKPSKGRSLSELIAEEQSRINSGGYGNTTFASSRNEKDLKPEDVWGYSAFGEKYGNDWLKKYSEKQRRQIAQKLLDAGAISERTGTIDINSNSDLERAIQQIISPGPVLKEGNK